MTVQFGNGWTHCGNHATLAVHIDHCGMYTYYNILYILAMAVNIVSMAVNAILGYNYPNNSKKGSYNADLDYLSSK